MRFASGRTAGPSTGSPSPEASFSAGLGSNPQPDTGALRLHYSSMVTPSTVFDYDIAAQTLVTRKVQEVPSGYDPALYQTARLSARGADGTSVPVSVVWRRDRGTPDRCHLYGYGAYGIAIPPSFSASRLSLLDRGFAYAIAHVRGGDDLGYGWYLGGKGEYRTNTFNDFIAAAERLIEAGFATAGNISTSGGSRRRHVDGRRRQPAAGPVARRRRARTVRRRARHHARRDPAVDPNRNGPNGATRSKAATPTRRSPPTARTTT